jgi:multiple sugar transport system permease protein
MQYKKRLNYEPYLFTIGALAWIGIFIIYPILLALWVSLHRLSLFRIMEGGAFIGLVNYLNEFKDPTFWLSLKVTGIYASCTAIGAFFLGLSAALMMNRSFKGRSLARTLLLLPFIIPELSAAFIWYWMYDRAFGIINYTLVKLALIQAPLGWLATPSLALPSIVVTSIWQLFPFAMVMLLAGLQTIPKELYDAGKVDGASNLQLFGYITWPSIRIVSLFAGLIIGIWSFKGFVMLYALTRGGPARTTEILGLRTYFKAFKFHNLGEGAATGGIILLILVCFTVTYYYIFLRKQVEEVLG